jgi:hypothetical protein
VRNIPTSSADADGHQCDGPQLLNCSFQNLVTFLTPARDVAIGTAKGAGSFVLTTGKMLVAGAISATFYTPPSMSMQVAHALTPKPVAKALQPANDTQAVTSTVTQGALTVLTVPFMGPEAGAVSGLGEASAINETFAEGSFSIIDWSGYPANLPKPAGPFRLLEGAEYADARAAANTANRQIHASDQVLAGQQIHEIQPVKFGGSPTDAANKIPLAPADHAPATAWWNRLMRDLQSVF